MKKFLLLFMMAAFAALFIAPDLAQAKLGLGLGLGLNGGNAASGLTDKFFADNAHADQFFADDAHTLAFDAAGIDRTLSVVFVGQSLMARGFTFYSGAGADAFEAEALALGYTTVNTINGALDSAGVNFGSNSTSGAVGSFLASGDATEGTVFTDNLVASVDASLIPWNEIDAAVYMIGNRDRLSIQGSFETEAEHKAGYRRLVELVAARAPFAIHVSGPNIGEIFTTPTTAQQEAWTATERAQYDARIAAASVAFAPIKQGPSQDDITRTDTQHPDQAGFEKQFRRMARAAGYYFGRVPVNPLGSSIASATYDATADSLTVTVTHEAATDFTISDSGGFWVYVNGTYQKPTTAARASATTFTLSGGLTITAADTVTLSYAAGTHDDLDNPATTSFLDNSANPLPLRHVFGLSVTDATPVVPTQKIYVIGDTVDDVFQYTATTGWDMSTGSYDSVSKDLTADETVPQSIFFKPDGTKMYIFGSNGDDVNQYTLSPAWDITSAGVSTTFSIAAQEVTGRAMFFKPDGTKMFIMGAAGVDINQYTLSSAWDISSASFVTPPFSVSTEEAAPQGLFFKPDGLTMYVVGSSGDEVNQYTLSSAWDVTSATATSLFSVAGQEISSSDIFFKSDGAKMYVLGTAGDDINQYTLSTPWDVTSASADSVTLSVGSQETVPNGFYMREPE